MTLRDFQKRPSSEKPSRTSMTPSPEIAPRMKLFKSSSRSVNEYARRRLFSQSADHGTNMRKRPISKQNRMKATARRRFMTLDGDQFPSSARRGIPPHYDSFLLCSLHFFEAGGLATEFAHVIELRSTDTSGTDDL